MGLAGSNTWQQRSQYKRGPHMLHSGTTGGSHYQPHVNRGVIVCGRVHACMFICSNEAHGP